LWLVYGHAGRAKPFDCQSNHCGFAIDAPYPNLVVGRIDGIASPLVTRKIYIEGRRLGFLRSFPSDSSAFTKFIQPISLEITPGHSITVLVATSEARLMGYKIGQYGRFAPHRGLNEKPRPDDPYWVGVGCVMLLCPDPNDNVCRTRYRSGIYRVSDGIQLNFSGRHVLAGGTKVDRFTMLPKAGNN
jgi:hypothetical protein